MGKITLGSLMLPDSDYSEGKKIKISLSSILTTLAKTYDKQN